MSEMIFMPDIINGTSAGLEKRTILDQMFKDRSVFCMGEITPESSAALILQIMQLQKENPEKEITMYINSPGGEVTGGLAVYDVMQACGCPIRTVCAGLAASMGALLFAGGGRREMLPHSRIMIHDPMVTGGTGGSALRIESLGKDLMKIREVTASILSRHTGKPIEEIYRKTAADSYFDAAEAVEFGLADGIIERI